MDLSQIVDTLCRAWSPEFDEPRMVRDDFTITGMSPAERRALRSKMRRLAKRAVLPLLQANRPMDTVTGRFVERRQTNPSLQAAFHQRPNMADGRFVERRNSVSPG
jgi:hypothetical protein